MLVDLCVPVNNLQLQTEIFAYFIWFRISEMSNQLKPEYKKDAFLLSKILGFVLCFKIQILEHNYVK
jgi:hypothetical protein